MLIERFIYAIKILIRRQSMAALRLLWRDLVFRNDYHFLVSRLRHEVHLLDKQVQSTFSPGHGHTRILTIEYLKRRMVKQNVKYDDEIHDILVWVESVVDAYQMWIISQKPQRIEKVTADSRVSQSVRNWKEIPIESQLLETIVTKALAAPASCNRQAFKICILNNRNKVSEQTKEISSMNSVMFKSCASRIFLFYDTRNYTEKYAAILDIGILSRDIQLNAEAENISVCHCYGSEELNPSQDDVRQLFGLNKYYYCAHTLLLGHADLVSPKPPRPFVNYLLDHFDA